MAVPSIATMPAAPSRAGDPANFFAESLAFLDAQPDLQTECNAVASYLNAVVFNVNDWGLITATPSGGSPVDIETFPDAAPTNPPLTGYPLIEAIDDMMVSIVSFVPEANAVAAYVDGFSDPLADPIVDPSRPVLSTVAVSPLRLDSPDAFNSKAPGYYNSLRAFAFLLNDLAVYATEFLSGTDDWSLITISHTSTDDWGSIV
jgi:hypothetical protein